MHFCFFPPQSMKLKLPVFKLVAFVVDASVACFSNQLIVKFVLLMLCCSSLDIIDTGPFFRHLFHLLYQS